MIDPRPLRQHRSFLTLCLGMAIGVCGAVLLGAARPRRAPSEPDAPVRVTMYRFEMNDDALPAFDRWMRWHRAYHEPIVATLEREHMYVEAMFRDTVAEPRAIYWLTVDGPGAQSVDDSPLPIDQQHNAFMREVIRKGSRRVLRTEFSLLPPFIDSAIVRHQVGVR